MKSVTGRLQNNHADGKLLQILLSREILVDGYEGVKLIDRETQEFPIGLSSQTLLRDRPDLEESFQSEKQV